MQKQSLQFLSMLVLLTVVTAINYNFFSRLGITGVTLLSLLVVVTAAYCCEFVVAILTAFLAFLVINYFFIEPRYTLEVAHIESWTSLVCFLIVSIVITSLVKQLKFQTLQSSIASNRAQFARTLAENLALATEVNQLLQDTCALLEIEFNKPIGIAKADNHGIYNLVIKSGLLDKPDNRLTRWVSDNGKPISPYTDYWTESPTQSKQWLLPFSRLPSKEPILIVGNINADESIETYTAIKSCVDQISQAYQRLINSEKVKLVESMAQAEAIQSALLASISHDMRTPLTSILGAATTLQQADLEPEQTAHLTSLIASQARYLATTTENILSLIRLESSAVEHITMDWQSPEELIGAVSALYESRNEKIDLVINISESELLIKGNANLLMQALVNLIDNAKQANLNHHPIEIDVTKTDGRINISINDRGEGFSDSFTTDKIKKFSSSHAKGFGLGLSIVQAVAKLHDAIFTIQDRENGGTSVTLSFNIPDIGSTNA